MTTNLAIGGNTMTTTRRLPVFEKFIQNMRAAWAEHSDLESRMKKTVKLLEDLVNDSTLRERSKSWPSTEGAQEFNLL